MADLTYPGVLFAALAALVATTLGTAPQAAAYTINVDAASGQLNYWGARRELFVVYDNSNGPSDVRANALSETAVSNSLAIGSVTYNGLSYELRAPGPFDTADITVKWAGKDDLVGGRRIFPNGTEAGITTKAVDAATGRFTSVTINMNRDLAWQEISDPLTRKFHLQTAVLHELVHGLGNKEVYGRAGRPETDRSKALDANGIVSLMFGTLSPGETRGLNAKDKNDLRYLLKQSLSPQLNAGLSFDDIGPPSLDGNRMTWTYRFGNSTGHAIAVNGFSFFVSAPPESLQFSSAALVARVTTDPVSTTDALVGFDDFLMSDEEIRDFALTVDMARWSVVSGQAGAGFDDSEFGVEIIGRSYLGPRVAMPEPSTVFLALLGLGMLFSTRTESGRISFHSMRRIVRVRTSFRGSPRAR